MAQLDQPVILLDMRRFWRNYSEKLQNETNLMRKRWERGEIKIREIFIQLMLEFWSNVVQHGEYRRLNSYSFLTNKQLERSWQRPWGDSRVLIEMFTGDSGDAAEDHLFWRKRDLFWRTFWRKHMESELEFNRDLRKEFKLLECQSLFEDWRTRNYHQEKYFLQPILVFFEIFCQ